MNKQDWLDYHSPMIRGHSLGAIVELDFVVKLHIRELMFDTDSAAYAVSDLWVVGAPTREVFVSGWSVAPLNGLQQWLRETPNCPLGWIIIPPRLRWYMNRGIDEILFSGRLVAEDTKFLPATPDERYPYVLHIADVRDWLPVNRDGDDRSSRCHV